LFYLGCECLVLALSIELFNLSIIDVCVRTLAAIGCGKRQYG
jgi:hypothetical protein